MTNPAQSLSQVERRRADVLIIGTGAAGLRAAIAVQEQGMKPLVVGKRSREDAHTVLAAGGINAALATMDPEDRWYIHAADTLFEGRMLGDPRAVDLLCKEAPRAIEELERYGAQFARGDDGRLLQRYFGAHRYRRTCFAGDRTGRTIMKALLGEIERRHIAVLDGVYISDLLLAGGAVNGALGFRLDSGEALLIHAGAVVLATGGHTYVYPRSTSRQRENTGDGMALALRAGARLAGMEMIQFHPTGMIWPDEAAGTLVTEAVRGEGGRMYNAKGERFMAQYDPERLELSTRDRVALANYREIAEGRGTEHGGVWLDVSHVPESVVKTRLPRMVEQFARYGVDLTRERVEVAPTAHYSMGGVLVEPDSLATEVPGLFACGEVSSGVHGANRLGGNSLTECIVFGRHAGEASAAHARQGPPLDEDQARGHIARLSHLAGTGEEAVLRLIGSLQHTMWARAGLIRNEEGLEGACRQIEHLGNQQRELAGRVAPNMSGLVATLDLESMLIAAEATVRAALARSESRGAHQRADYPDEDPQWQRTIVISQQGARLGLTTRPLPEPPDEISAALRETGEVDITGRLLE